MGQRYTAKKIAGKIVVALIGIFVLSVLVFTISRLTPVDPLQAYYGDRVEKMSVEDKNAARDKLGLNEPIPTQYIRWLENAVHGDFGISYKYKRPVTEMIAGRIGNTLLLGGTGFVLTFAGALFLGLLCAGKENSRFDRWVCKVGTLSSCIPEFWLALIAILIFCVLLKVLPSSGAYTIGQEHDILDRIRHLILPMAVIILEHLWYYTYLIRNRLLEETRKDYVLLCRAKGLNDRQILCRHCLKNILPTYLNLMAVSVSHILGGTYIVEMVFSYPGLGSLCYESVRLGDYNMLMVLCLLTGAVVICCNVIAQVLSEKADPRVC